MKGAHQIYYGTPVEILFRMLYSLFLTAALFFLIALLSSMQHHVLLEARFRSFDIQIKTPTAALKRPSISIPRAQHAQLYSSGAVLLEGPFKTRQPVQLLQSNLSSLKNYALKNSVFQSLECSVLPKSAASLPALWLSRSLAISLGIFPGETVRLASVIKKENGLVPTKLSFVVSCLFSQQTAPIGPPFIIGELSQRGPSLTPPLMYGMRLRRASKSWAVKKRALIALPEGSRVRVWQEYNSALRIALLTEKTLFIAFITALSLSLLFAFKVSLEKQMRRHKPELFWLSSLGARSGVLRARWTGAQTFVILAGALIGAGLAFLLGQLLPLLAPNIPLYLPKIQHLEISDIFLVFLLGPALLILAAFWQSKSISAWALMQEARHE